ATGAYPLSYQWKLQGIDVPGATRSLLILTNLQPDQAGEYTVRVRNGFGEESSAIASLYLAPLQIDRQPQSQARAVGDSISFDVMVRGIEPLHYQWRHNGTDIPGGTERNLRLDALADSDSGGYGVIITNDYGQVLSATAQLTIFPVLITDQPKDQVSYRGGNASFSVTCNGIT